LRQPQGKGREKEGERMAPVGGLVFCFNYDKSTVERFLIQIEFKVAIYASMIYTALYIMFLMRADSL
jgi:hypothetical protein